MENIEERYQSASISLPDRMEQGEFINFLQQTAEENQVKILSMIPSAIKPFDDKANANFEDEDEAVENEDKIKINSDSELITLPISVKIECGYIPLINFLKAIEDSERMTQIKNLSVISKDDGEKLNCELNMIIFALEKQ